MKDGGPAFPQHGWSKDPETLERMKMEGGMSLRNWFAGTAAHDDLDIPQTVEDCAAMLGIDKYVNTIHYPRLISMARYRYADAMLAEREKEEPCD